MKRKLQICLFALLAIISVGWAVTTATSLTLTVDGNKETNEAEHTFKTLQEAIVVANTAMEANVIISIVPGSYTGEAQPAGFTEGSATTFGELTKENTTIQKAGDGEVVLNGALRVKGENAIITGLKFVNKGGNMDESKNSLYVTAKKVTITGNVFTQDKTIEQDQFVCNGVKLEPGSGPVDYTISGNTFKGMNHLSQPVSENYEYWCSTAIIWKESTDASRLFGSYEIDKQIAFESENVFEGCTENYSRCSFPGSEERFYFQVTAASYLGSDEMGRRTFVNNAPVYLFGEGSFNADVTISQPIALIALADSKLKFDNEYSLIIDANNVVLSDLDITSTKTALKINKGKTGIQINKGTYTCSVPNAEGVGAIYFLGQNGDINVSGASLTGKLGIEGVTGGLNGITGNTIKYTSKEATPVVGISAVFDNNLAEGVISPVELAAQNSITMPANGAQYPVLYENREWKGVDGLAYADNTENLKALVGNGDGVKENVLVKLKANASYSFSESLTIQQEGMKLEGADGAKLQFTSGGMIIDADKVTLNNLNVETQAGAPVTINASKTGTVVDKGSYSYNTLNSGHIEEQGQSAIRFLGSNGNVNVSDVTANGIFVDACNGTLTGIKGNTIGFDYEGPVSWAGINIKFSGDNSECADIDVEALVGQNKITMPAKGAQYQALYQKSDWTALAGLATAGTADVLIALATDGKNNIQVNLANDLVLTAPALFTQTGMTLDGKGKTISVSDDFEGGEYPIILGNNNSSQTGTFKVKDLTLDSRSKVKGLDIYQMAEVTLDKVTLKNSKGAGLVVNGSKVTASALVTESNEWGGVNVGPGLNVASDCALTLLGSDNDLKEEAPIYVDAKDFALIDAAEGQKIVITSPGYIMGEKESGKTTVWTKFVVPEGGIASEDALKEAVENNQKEIVLKPAEGGAELPIELNETLTVKAEMTIKSEDPETPVVISVPAGTSAFATGEGGNLTLENVVVKAAESQSGGSEPVISVIAGTEATLQNSKLEVPASVTAIKAEGQMILSNVEMTVTDITAGTEAPVINVTSGGDVTIDNAAITNGTIEVTGKLTVTPAENAEVVFTQSGDKPAIDLKDGATVTVSEAQFSGKAVTAASGATIKLSNCNFSSPIESKAMMMTKATANDATVVNAGDATAEIECCIFTGITGTNPMIYGKNLTIKNCLFYDNADMVMIDIAASGNSVIANNTCVNNNTDATAAIINNALSTAAIKNNILWTNATEAITGTATGDNISHNALKTAATTVEANSLKLPTFAYIQFNHTNRKYQLHADSPVAKAHGDITGIADDATDLLGNARLTSDGTNKTVHLGAYESVYTPSSGGGSTGGSGDETPSATGIKLDKTTLALHRLESYTLKATVEPSNAGGVKWTSTDPSVVTVDANGKVTAVKVGEATIIATAINGGLTALCQVTVDFATGVEEALAETVVYGREGYIQIQPATPIQILVVNMAGVAVANRTVSQTETISVPKGIYIVRMSSGGHVVTQKVNVR